MSDIKYTKNGKKVAVLGKLNSDSWIVQEIFVSNGQEYPSGENFIEKTLLDEPAETWEMREKKSLESRRKELQDEIEKLKEKAQVIRRKIEVTDLINRATLKYQNIKIEQLDTLFAFLSGNITHIVKSNYGDYEISSLSESVKDEDSWNGYRNIDGLKLVSLFGCTKDGERHEDGRNFSLDWRINQYRDGSGSSWTTVYPCKSYEEAVELVDSLIADKDATESLVQLKEKYDLKNPTQKKIKELRKKQVDAKQAELAKQKATIEKLENELKVIRSLQ